MTTSPLRPTWDTYGLGIALAVATRADCSRLKVGAVILGPDHRLVSAGYNGSRPGGPSCLAGECPRGRSDVPHGSSYGPEGPGACHAIHAETNAVAYADPVRSRGGTIYVTARPCYMCRGPIQAAGIVRAVWLEDGAVCEEVFQYTPSAIT